MGRVFESFRPNYIIQGVARLYLAPPHYFWSFYPPSVKGFCSENVLFRSLTLKDKRSQERGQAFVRLQSILSLIITLDH